MSFSYNPFRHIEILNDDRYGFRLLCPSCGGHRPKRDKPPLLPHTPLIDIFLLMKDHAREHGLTEEDVKDWSIE